MTVVEVLPDSIIVVLRTANVGRLSAMVRRQRGVGWRTFNRDGGREVTPLSLSNAETVCTTMRARYGALNGDSCNNAQR